MKSHPYSLGRRKPNPNPNAALMADLVELCPTLKDEKARHGGSKARGQIKKVRSQI